MGWPDGGQNELLPHPTGTAGSQPREHAASELKRLQSKKSQLTALEVPSDDLWRGPWVGAGGDPGTLPRFVLSDWSHGRIHLARTTEPIRVLFSMYSVLQLKGVFWFFFY